MIKPWIFEFFPAPANPAHDAGPGGTAAHFAAYLDLWQRTEALGFEGIFFSEHHFGRGVGAWIGRRVGLVCANAPVRFDERILA